MWCLRGGPRCAMSLRVGVLVVAALVVAARPEENGEIEPITDSTTSELDIVSQLYQGPETNIIDTGWTQYFPGIKNTDDKTDEYSVQTSDKVNESILIYNRSSSVGYVCNEVPCSKCSEDVCDTDECKYACKLISSDNKITNDGFKSDIIEKLPNYNNTTVNKIRVSRDVLPARTSSDFWFDAKQAPNQSDISNNERKPKILSSKSRTNNHGSSVYTDRKTDSRESSVSIDRKTSREDSSVSTDRKTNIRDFLTADNHGHGKIYSTTDTPTTISTSVTASGVSGVEERPKEVLEGEESVHAPVYVTIIQRTKEADYFHPTSVYPPPPPPPPKYQYDPAYHPYEPEYHPKPVYEPEYHPKPVYKEKHYPEPHYGSIPHKPKDPYAPPVYHDDKHHEPDYHLPPPTKVYGLPPPKPHDEYGLPHLPHDEYGLPPPKPHDEYGLPPLKPHDEYGLPPPEPHHEYLPPHEEPIIHHDEPIYHEPPPLPSYHEPAPLKGYLYNPPPGPKLHYEPAPHHDHYHEPKHVAPHPPPPSYHEPDHHHDHYREPKYLAPHPAPHSYHEPVPVKGYAYKPPHAPKLHYEPDHHHDPYHKPKYVAPLPPPPPKAYHYVPPPSSKYEYSLSVYDYDDYYDEYEPEYKVHRSYHHPEPIAPPHEILLEKSYHDDHIAEVKHEYRKGSRSFEYHFKKQHPVHVIGDDLYDDAPAYGYVSAKYEPPTVHAPVVPHHHYS